jgi:Domain of unknown function (DUF4838)
MKLSQVILTGLYALMGLLLQSCHATDLQLVADRKPMAGIVLPESPSAVEKKSAAVLQDYARRITGATLPILKAPSVDIPHLLFIGKAAVHAAANRPPAPLKTEGYEIDIHDGNVYFYGGSGKGLLYGVYELIEKQFGARKYSQGPAKVPHSSELSLPVKLHVRYEPMLLYRESYYPPSTDPEYLDWHHLHRFEDLWGVWGHSFFKIISPERYFQVHPEYFAWVNGHRQASQLCLSNPDVLRLATAYFEKAIAANPDAIYWSIAPMDGTGYCTCEKCARVDSQDGGPQGSLIRFVNAVAAHFPNQIFTTLAYGYSAEAPEHTRPEKNVYVMLSTIDATRQLPLVSDPQAAPFRRQLAAWAKLTPNLFVWDYTTDFTAYLNPFPMYDHYRANIQYLYDHSIKGIFEQGSGETWSDMSTYVSYLQAKFLWDPFVKADEIQDDFLNGYYGAAAPQVKSYILQLLNARDETHARLGIYDDPAGHRADYLAPDRISGYRRYLKKAEEAVIGSPELMDRINSLSLGMEYVELEQARTYGIHPGGYLEEQPDAAWRVKPAWPHRVQRFAGNAQAAGATRLSETGGTLQDYVASWQNIMRYPYRPSLILGEKATFSHPFVEDYPANRAETLTDGLTGGTDYNFNWLLFGDSSIIITYPLKSGKLLKLIKTDFLSDPAHYLFLPDQVNVEASEDGKQFTLIGGQRFNTGKPSTMDATIHTIECPLQPNLPVRYLRLVVQFSGRLPDWFNGRRNRKPLIAIDEISLE